MRYALFALALLACGGPEGASSIYDAPQQSAVSLAPVASPAPVNDPTATPAVATPAFTVADCTPLCPGAASISFGAGGTFSGPCGGFTVQPSCSCSCAATLFIQDIDLSTAASRAQGAASWAANCP